MRTRQFRHTDCSRGKMRARDFHTSALSEMYTGSCLCGGVRFTVKGELAPIQLCYCTQCRKAQGTPFASNTPVSTAAFNLESGAELLQSFESSPGKQRVFCGRCGSPLYSRKDSLPDVLRLRAGLLDQPLPVKPVSHAYVASKPNWWSIQDELPQFAAAQP
jgi:hypothetical protein